MAYSLRPDGLYDVTLGPGVTLPMSLTEQQLRDAGHEPAQAAMVPDLSTPLPQNVVAGPGGAPTDLGNEPPPASFFQPPQPAERLPSLAEQQGAHGAAPAAPAPAPIGPPPPPAQKGVHETPTNVPNAAGGQRGGRSFSELASIEPKGTVKPDELVSYQPPAGGTGGAPPETPAKGVGGAGGGGGGAGKKPDSGILASLKGEVNNDRRPEQQLEGAFSKFYGEEDARLEHEKNLSDRQKEVDAEKLQRAGVNEMLRRKEETIAQRDREADKLTPKTAGEVWADKSTSAQVGAVMFAAFAGILGGWKGIQGAMDQLRGIANDEVQSQKLRFEAKMGQRDAAANDYAKALQIYGSPEAAALDQKMRSYALMDQINQSHAQAVGSQQALDTAIQISQGLRIEREKAKQELLDLERLRIQQKAAAAGQSGNAAALARQGIVKIGKDFYTVDKGTGQFVPLDKAAALAQKGIENGPEGGIAPRSYQTVLRANTAQTALNDLGHAIGAKRDPKTGKWEVVDKGRYAKSLVYGTEAYNEAQAARGQLAGEHAVIVNGGNQPSVDEKKEYEAKWHAIRPGAVESNMHNLQANIDETIRTAKTTRIRKEGEAGEGADAEP